MDDDTNRPARHPRAAPAALALVAAAFALVVVFFAMVLARLVTMAADHLDVAALLHRAARALGLAP
jgi:hypothetical protein